MKRLTISIGILAIVVALEIWGLFWVRDYSAELSDRLTKMSAQVGEQDLLPQLNEMEEDWQQHRRVMSLFIHEKLMDDFESNLTEARYRLLTDQPEADLWLRMAADAAAEIWEMERPTLQNIL